MQTSKVDEPQKNLNKGLFTKELEVALLQGEADMAIHSLKDLPTDLPTGLILGAVGKRADVRDVIIHNERGFKSENPLDCLPKGATVGTCSTRRMAQLKHLRPDLNFRDLRGNVLTRIQKLKKVDDLDATILAAAGLARLGYSVDERNELQGDRMPEGVCAVYIHEEMMLPCVGQAALGMEIRAGDTRMAKICEAINDQDTHSCVDAERAFLAGMGGGCQSPVAAYARIIGTKLHIKATIFTHTPPRSGELKGAIKDAVDMGAKLAESLKSGK